jgi:hypothetical protein
MSEDQGDLQYSKYGWKEVVMGIEAGKGAWGSYLKVSI